MPRKKKVEEEIEHINAGVAPTTPEEIKEDEGEHKHEAPAREAKSNPMFDKVRVTIPVELKIGKRTFRPGQHIVERHQVDTIVEMVNKKQKSDLAVHVGNNYLVQRRLDGMLNVTKVDELDMNKLVRR